MNKADQGVRAFWYRVIDLWNPVKDIMSDLNRLREESSDLLHPRDPLIGREQNQCPRESPGNPLAAVSDHLPSL